MLRNRYRTLIISIVIITRVVSAQGDSNKIVWPSPPEQARIQYVRTISSLQSFEQKQGFISGIFGFLFGDESSAQWFVQPLGITVSSAGKLYVTDPGAGIVHVIDQKEKEYSFIKETEFGNFISPVGCAMSSDGILFISDSERGDIIALDEDDDALFKISDHITRPTGLQVQGDRLYVTETGRHAVVVFDLKGNYVTEFGRRGEGAGEFNFPVQLSVRDSIYVIDALNYRVQKFDLTGNVGSTFGKQGNVTGRFASPKGIALDSDGNIYVTDALMDCLQIFNAKGELLLVVGKKGTGAGEFMTPSGIAIDREDNIYIVESLNRRIQVFRYIK
ncbi:MAG: 6-bladed beta-propeller [Bacteroidetes bacterium]|nr:MAG: 6-bladed beta-propeller [Bacteroidota bacterium]